MRPTKLPLLAILVALPHLSLAQDGPRLCWRDPASGSAAVIEGQAWPGQSAPFTRLPDRAKASVRPEVWSLSRHSAGLVVRFRTDSPSIHVRYRVEGPAAMPHMPATGVSGVDLYAKDADGRWLWAKGRYAFGDTVLYRFDGLEPHDRYHEMGREYRLYLPLYNALSDLRIGVEEGAAWSVLPPRREKPIVVYGTSIAHGACASRPGMAWTAILGRALDRPLINLGFSGNGQLEPALLDLIGEIDAAAVILDCLPNLWSAADFPREEVGRRIREAVRGLRRARPDVPILLADHAGYADGSIVAARRQDPLDVNRVQHRVFEELRGEGVPGLSLLTREEIGLGLDDMVDGTHPSDRGMAAYAAAYEKALRAILAQPAGPEPSAIPATQYREPGLYDWEARHQEILRMNAEGGPRAVFLGDSITHYWGGEPAHPLHRGEDSWAGRLAGGGTRNLGFGWDLIENVLYRVYHDELDGYEAERVLISIGTNNLSRDSDVVILAGMRRLLEAVRARQPRADVLLLGLYPRRGLEKRVRGLNRGYARLAKEKGVRYADPGRALLGRGGTIDEALFVDGLHPNAEGYRRIAAGLR
jgi:lysophospholipase L1-like esterase